MSSKKETEPKYVSSLVPLQERLLDCMSRLESLENQINSLLTEKPKKAKSAKVKTNSRKKKSNKKKN